MRAHFYRGMMVLAAGLAVQAQPPGPYQKWVDEDVAYIIQPEERAVYLRLTTNEERNQFIGQFWLRRDPTPGTEANERKEEHYRRIAYSNERFADSIPGWKTKRGRFYIRFGPPDEIESHPGRKESWRYWTLEGVGENITVEFDLTGK